MELLYTVILQVLYKNLKALLRILFVPHQLITHLLIRQFCQQ